MNIPFTFGWPQVILFIVGLFGLSLLISAVMGGRSHYMTEEELEEYKRSGRRPRRQLRFGRAIGGLILVAAAVSLLWATFVVQSYLGLTGDIQVAKVRAAKVANIQDELSVELILYDTHGHETSDKTYIVKGNEWMLQGDFIKFPTWLNILGLHSGYKLTRLEGRYDKSELERTAPHTVIDLNGGDDNFFKAVYNEPSWVTTFAEASYGTAVFSAGGAYDVFVSQTGLFDKPAA